MLGLFTFTDNSIYVNYLAYILRVIYKKTNNLTLPELLELDFDSLPVYVKLKSGKHGSKKE